MIGVSENLESVFNSLGWQFKKLSTGYQLNCPFAKFTHPSGVDRNPSCIVWQARNYWKCYSCGERGDLNRLFSRYGELANIHVEFRLDPLLVMLSENSEKEKPILELDESILEIFEDDLEYVLQSRFCQERNFSPEALRKHNILADKFRKMMIFPVRGTHGELLGAVGRSLTGNRKHNNFFHFPTGKTLGGIDKLSERPKIALVEGMTDLLKCTLWAEELGYDVVCSWTANVTKEQARLLLDSGKVIHCWYDQDPAGMRGWSVLERLCKSDYGLTRHCWNSGLDVGSMTAEQFFSIFKE